MKGFQEQMVSALAFKPDHFVKTEEHELILIQTLFVDNIKETDRNKPQLN